MKHWMNIWMAAFALISCVACSKTETELDTMSLTNETGKVYGYFEPFDDDDAPVTRGYRKANFSYVFEKNDQINIWSTTGSLMIFKVVNVFENGRAEFAASGFDLTKGSTYYSTYPFVLNNVVNPPTAQVVTFEGQTQTDQSGAELRDFAKFVYCCADAVCDDNGNTSFNFRGIGTQIKMIITLPESGMTIKEVALKADHPVFALNGTFDVTTKSFTRVGDLSDTMTLSLDNVTVSGNVLTAFLGSAPLEAATYTISVTDTDEKVYTSDKVEKAARNAHSTTTFEVTVESEDKEYVKVTSIDPADPDIAGKYILVYPNGTTYRAFSFTKAMENAEAAGELAKDTHGLENILAMGSQLYATVVANNCIDVEGPANAESLVLTPDQEKEAAFEVSLLDADHAWDLVDGKVTLSATTQKGNSYSIGIDHAVVNVNGNADVVVAFNAPDVINAMKAIRGTDLPVDFDYLINLAVAQAMKEGITFTPAQIARLKSGFEHLCVLAKSMVASHPEVFGSGTLMDINLSTNVFDVVGRYYDNATQLSWAIAPQKRFGLATLGYHAYDQGFTFNVGLPQAGWFNRLEESLKYDADNDGVLEVEDCVTYWKQFDSQYNLGIPNFFERASRRALSELDSTTLLMLQQMAATGKFAAIGNVYKQYADRFNDELEPVYIYKKVE